MSLTLHPLGFIQLKLPGNQRIHVWHPDLPTRACAGQSNIHNHRFGFFSKVLVGTLEDTVYDITPAPPPLHATHAAYSHDGARLPTGCRPWTHVGDVLVSRRKSSIIVTAGQEYMTNPYDFHSTTLNRDGKVATLMTKHNIHTYPSAVTLCAADQEPHEDFDRHQVSDHDMWAIIRDVMGEAA